MFSLEKGGGLVSGVKQVNESGQWELGMDCHSDFYSYANPSHRLAGCWEPMGEEGWQREAFFFVVIVMQIRSSSQPESAESQNLRM